MNLNDLTEEKIRANWDYMTQSQREALADYLYGEVQNKKKCELYDDTVSFTRWAMDWFYIPETSSPIYLYPHQRKAIETATQRDKNGLFKYSLIHYGDIKKSGKTTIAAMVALRFAFMRQWASIKVVGQKLDQAKSRSYFYICRALDLNPIFAEMQAKGEIIVNQYTIYIKPTNSIIQAIPASPSTESGGNDDCIIWTEIGSAKTEAAKQLWTELVIPPRKYGYGIKWVEGYAGHLGQSPILEELYNNNVKEEYRISDNPDMYSNSRTFVMWNSKPRLDRFQTKEYYSQQSAELSEPEFRRVHKNEWVSSQNKFVDDIILEKIIEKMPALTTNELIITAADAGVSGDCFAFVGVTKHPTRPGCYAARLCKLWKPEKDHKLIFEHPNESENAKLPDGYITNLCKSHKIKWIEYDPYQLHSLATKHNLSRKSAYWEEFPQGTMRLEADVGLQRAIIDSKLYIDSSLTELIQHIKNADSETNDENKLRLVKRNQALKIDAAVCLSMALYKAMKLKL